LLYKEANETDYWLELIYRGGWMSKEEKFNFQAKNTSLIKLLISIIKKRKENLRKRS